MTDTNGNETVSRLPAPSFLPTVAVLEMTYRCNHSCLFCSCPWFAPDSGFDVRKELDVSQWKEAITMLCANGVTDIAFTGGEPLLKEGLTDIIKHAASCTALYIENKDGRAIIRKAPPRLFLLSNGLIMNNSFLKLCKRHKIHLSLSLPGLKSFSYLTGQDNGAAVLMWFEKAAKMGVASTVGVTVTRQNLGELFETISAAFLAGADMLLMNRFLPGGRGLMHREELELNREQIIEMMDTAEDVLSAANRKGSVGTELPKCLADIEKYSRLEVGTRCSAAIDFFVVGPSGYLRVCNHSTVRLNHIDDVDCLKENPYWKRFIIKDYLPLSCSGCEWITACDGGCREAAHIVGKALDARDPVLE